MKRKRKFTKPPLTLDKQINLLKSRGLSIPDEERAKAFLRQVQYARLRPYWHPLEVNPRTHRFKPGSSFEEIVRLYELDRRLRLLTLEAIERIEVALRSQWAYELAHHSGPWAYKEVSLHASPKYHQDDLNSLLKEWDRGKGGDPILKHYHNTYKPNEPPIWLACEVISFGTLSRFFANLKDKTLSEAIAQPFALPQSFLKGAIKHLVVVRNIAAHHGRLWDREITAYTLPSLRDKPKLLKEALDRTKHPQKVFRTFSLLLYVMRRLGDHEEWEKRFRDLLSQYGNYLHERMGFPEDYLTLDLWRHP